ncbi:aspartic peptidase domain-containing protein [Infundibulicybe gibba]|nr:aspartic peptidase domain-containing protein [Infundibulicybe gibba]
MCKLYAPLTHGSVTNQNADSSFFGSLAVGTPPISYNVILDTGSADLWLADRACTSGCTGIPTFDSSASSTFESKATPFSITYGSGQATGLLGQDTVQMAGFSVTNQVFGVCDVVSTGLLASPVSGLLGLGFESIAASGALPFWQALVQGGTWDAPVMSFQFSRYLDDPSADSLEPGGTFTMGFVNSSLFTGDIEYLNLASKESYWILSLTTIRVQGNVMTMPPGPSSFAAIDTGTTLIGGPPSAIANVYAQIPGSEPGSDDFDGFYTYPCDTTVNISLSFGGREWAMSPKDFHLTMLDKGRCLGAFFQIDTGGSAPAWIVGDTFLVSRPPLLSLMIITRAEKCVLCVPVFSPVCGICYTINDRGGAQRSGRACAISNDWNCGCDCVRDGEDANAKWGVGCMGVAWPGCSHDSCLVYASWRDLCVMISRGLPGLRMKAGRVM